MKAEIFIGVSDIDRKYYRYKTKKGYLSPEVVLKFVADNSKVSIADLASSSRKQEVAKYRHCYAWLYRQLMLKKGYMTTMVRNNQMPKFYKAKFATEGKVMGLVGRKHCTGDNAYKSFEHRLLTDKELSKKAYQWLEELNSIL